MLDSRQREVQATWVNGRTMPTPGWYTFVIGLWQDQTGPNARLVVSERFDPEPPTSGADRRVPPRDAGTAPAADQSTDAARVSRSTPIARLHILPIHARWIVRWHMIIRVFAARLKPGMRGEYERLCREAALPLMRDQPGCLSARIEHVREERPNDFVLVSLWRDLDSLRAFVGERWQEAIILPGEADLLQEIAVRHFDESYRSLVALWRAMADMVKRRELSLAATPLSEEQWELLQPLLPPPNKEGRPRADDRSTLDGILYVLRSGCRWRDLPAVYGSPITCWRRFRQWEADGTWERIWHVLFDTLDAHGKQAWALSFVDSRCVYSRSDQDFVPSTRRRGTSSA